MLMQSSHNVGGESIGQIYDQLYTPDGLDLNAAAFKTPVIYIAMNYIVNSKSKSKDPRQNQFANYCSLQSSDLLALQL
jgi:hypothetical protein